MTHPEIMNQGKADVAGDRDFLRQLLELKGQRFVRSAEGARRFGKPIGSLITRADRQKAKEKRSGGKKRTPSVDAFARGGDRVEVPVSDFGDLSERDLTVLTAAKIRIAGPSWRAAGQFSERQEGGGLLDAPHPENSGDRKKKLTAFSAPMGGNLKGSFNIGTDAKGNYVSRVADGPNRQIITSGGNTEKDLDDLIEASLRLMSSRNQRLTKNRDGYDATGRLHRNRRPRDYDGLVERNEGVRGWDYQVDGDEEIDWKSYEQRAALARAEAADIGFSWDDSPYYAFEGKGRIDVGVMEHINSLMRTHEDMYPGFGALIDTVTMSGVRQVDSIGWNAATPVNTEFGERRYWNGLGFSSKFFSTASSAKREREDQIGISGMARALKGDEGKERYAEDVRNAARVGRVDGDIHFYSTPPAVLMDAYGWDEKKAFTTMVATHEIGHTVGYILQNRIPQNGKVENVPRTAGGSKDESIGDFHRKRMLEIFEDYGMLKADLNASTQEMHRWMMVDGKGFSKTDPFDRDAIAEHLSNYGATNVSEIMAETWAAYQLHPNPGDFVREMGELMEAALEDFLSEEDPSIRYKPYQVRNIRAANGDDAPMARPDFANYPEDGTHQISIPSQRGGGARSYGGNSSTRALVIKRDPPVVVASGGSTWDNEAQTWRAKPGIVMEWIDATGWTPAPEGKYDDLIGA